MASLTMGWSNSWYTPKKYTQVRNLVYNYQSRTVLGVISGDNGQINKISINGSGSSGSGESSGGGTTIVEGTKNYRELNNKPSINNVVLNGNKTTADLKLDYQALINKPNVITDYDKLSNRPKINGKTLTGDTRLDLGLTKYDDAPDRPAINGVTLTGNKTLAELGINIPKNVSELTNDVNYITETDTDQKLSQYIKTSDLTSSLLSYYDKQQIDNKLSAVFTYKGTLADTMALNKLTNANIGDVYRVGTNDKYEFYAKTEKGWDNWGSSFVDLSNYVTFNDVVTDTSTKPGLIKPEDKKKLDQVAVDGEANKINSITVNGIIATPDAAKNVNINVPIQSIEIDGNAALPNADGKVSLTTNPSPVKQVNVDGKALTPDSKGAVNIDLPDVPIKSISMNGTDVTPDYDGKVTLSGGSGSYTGSASITVGGITAGTKFTNESITNIIDRLINPYQKPTIGIAISPNTTVYETGTTTNSITVTARAGKKSKDIKAVKFYVDGALKTTITTGVANGGNFTYTAGTFNKATTFKVEVEDDDNTVSASASIAFANASYYGIVDVAPANVSASIISGLTKRVSTNKTFTYSGITMTNKRIVYAIPAALGAISSIVDGNGYQVVGSYTKGSATIGGVAYNVYTLTDTATLSGGKMIFS